MAEKSNQQVEISQPQISYEAYVSSYASFLDMVLQGIISPSTLGIDLKKTDNAESQREKEKVTFHVRNKIVDALNETLPKLIRAVLQCYDLRCYVTGNISGSAIRRHMDAGRKRGRSGTPESRTGHCRAGGAGDQSVRRFFSAEYGRRQIRW